MTTSDLIPDDQMQSLSPRLEITDAEDEPTLPLPDEPVDSHLPAADPPVFEGNPKQAPEITREESFPAYPSLPDTAPGFETFPILDTAPAPFDLLDDPMSVADTRYFRFEQTNTPVQRDVLPERLEDRLDVVPPEQEWPRRLPDLASSEMEQLSPAEISRFIFAPQNEWSPETDQSREAIELEPSVELPLMTGATPVDSKAEDRIGGFTVNAPIEIHIHVDGHDAESADDLREELQAVVPNAVHDALEQLALQLGVM